MRNSIKLILLFLVSSLPLKALSEAVPNFVGTEGYVVLGDLNDEFYCGIDSGKYKKLPESPWSVCALKQKGPSSWDEETSKKVQHKSKIKVLSQNIKPSATRYGDKYHGTMQVKLLDTGKAYTIDLKNFSTNEFWLNSSVENAMKHGYLIAKYNGNTRPIDKNGKWVDIKKGATILVSGRTGTYANVDRDTYSITAFTYKNWKYGFGGVETFYSPSSLELIY